MSKILLNFSVLLLLSFVFNQNTYAFSPTIRSIKIRSAESSHQLKHPEALILRQMKSKPGMPFSQSVLDDDIARLFKLNWFYDVKCHITNKINPDITVTVVEKRKITQISYSGIKKIRSVKLNDVISTRIGEYVNPFFITRDKEAIQKLYQEKGYYFADIRVEYKDHPEGVELIFVIDERKDIRISEIIFEGNAHIKKDELLDVMKNKEDGLFTGGIFNEEEFEKDLIRLRYVYISKGWINATITSDGFYTELPTEKANKVTTPRRTDQRWLKRNIAWHPIQSETPKERVGKIKINIIEGKRYRINKVVFVNNIKISTEELMDAISPEKVRHYPDERALETTYLKVGGFYSPLIIDRARKIISDKYGHFGYMFTQVRVNETVVDNTTDINLTFNIKEGRPTTVNEIKIEGNDKTRDVVIRRELQFYPGDKLTSDVLNKSRNNLRNLDFFENVSVEPVEIDKEKGISDVIIKVKEKNTGQFRFGVGFSSVDSIVGTVSVQQRNFDWRAWPYPTGDGQSAGVVLKLGSDSKTVALNFTEPYINDLPIRTGFNIYNTTTSADLYDSTKRGLELFIGKKIMKDTYLNLTYGYVRNEISDMDDGASDLLKNEVGTEYTTYIGYSLNYNTVDSIFLPTEGWKASASSKFYVDALGGKTEMIESALSASYFYKISDTFGEKPHVLMFRGRLNTIGTYGDTEYVPLYNRYFAGGQSTVRGYPSGELTPVDNQDENIGGTFRPIINVEYTYPLYEELVRGAVFFDAGYAFLNSKNASVGNMHKSYGLGIRVKTPLGPMPIALDYGWALDTDDGRYPSGRFDFSFGALF